MILRWLIGYLDKRLHMARPLREMLDHVFPDHWSFMLGEIALYCFIILVITGTYLALFFNASAETVVYHGSYRALDGVSMSAAYRSALHISFGIPAGLLVRQMHHWAALIFVAAIVAHLARIFFTGAYRRPREINWIIGLTLFLLAMLNGFLGYSLPDDLLSATGLRIAYAVTLSIPFVGPWMAFIMFGGTVPTKAAIPRMYALHIFVVPALIAVLIGTHMFILWRQYHTNYPGPGRTDRTIVGSRLWPTYAAKTLGLFFLVFGAVAALGGLVQINPIWIYGPNNPAAALTGAQPDFYLGWLEGALRLFPGVNLRIGSVLIPEIFFPGVLLPMLIFGLMYTYPFFERWLTGDTAPHNVLRMPYETPVKTAFGCAVFALILVLLFAGSDDVIATATNGSVVTIRLILQILFFVVPVVTAFLVYAGCKMYLKRRSAARSL